MFKILVLQESTHKLTSCVNLLASSYQSCTKKKSKFLIFFQLYESYCRVCRSRQLNCVSQEEFGGICTLLESQGIIALKEMKDVRNNKVS